MEITHTQESWKQSPRGIQLLEDQTKSGSSSPLIQVLNSYALPNRIWRYIHVFNIDTFDCYDVMNKEKSTWILFKSEYYVTSYEPQSV